MRRLDQTRLGDPCIPVASITRPQLKLGLLLFVRPAALETAILNSFHARSLSVLLVET